MQKIYTLDILMIENTEYLKLFTVINNTKFRQDQENLGDIFFKWKLTNENFHKYFWPCWNLVLLKFNNR